MKIRRIEYEYWADTHREVHRTDWKELDRDKLWTTIYNIKRGLARSGYNYYDVVCSSYDLSIRIFGWHPKYDRPVEYIIQGFILNKKDRRAFREWHKRQTGEWPAL